MDKHTFIGKRKVGSTDVCDFTDYQGIGRDPLYKRYESVHSIVKKTISPEYAHFLAAPDYSPGEDAVNWYIDEWTEIPETLANLDGQQRERYKSIKDETLAHYKDALNRLGGEELQVMACALRYIDDDFIFCCDGKVYVVAWGMTPDTRKHISRGELVHEMPHLAKYRLTFDAGEHGALSSKTGENISLPEGTVINANDIPAVVPEDGYVFTGWNPEPLGTKVESDMTFAACYDFVPSLPPLPPLPPEPENAVCRFDAGAHGTLRGNSEFVKGIGSGFLLNEIPAVVPHKGYTFTGWDVNPAETIINGDITFNALYEKKLPWYKRLWLWLKGPGKWLLWLLLALLLLLLGSWLLKDCCGGCARTYNGVAPIDRIVGESGDTIEDNGTAVPIELHDGRLPDESSIVAPIRDENGELPPIVREPGLPPTIGDRLLLFLENENDNIDAFAADFKKAYPGDRYSIIGFDRDVKSLLIQVPEDEKEEIRKTINSRIPNHRFIVFDEEIYELNGHQSDASDDPEGWHLKAVKAPQAWNITKGSPSVVVAVVDDGIDATHPIFKDRIVDAYNVFTQNNRLGNGEGHGTHTAGLAVGSQQFLSQGASGIAPDCKLMPVQVIDNGMCPLSALISGIMYSVHKGADVVNVSIGPSFQGLNMLPVEVQDEIARTQFKNVEKLWNRVCRIAASKNTILVFAAGNDDILSSIPPENRTSVAITVGAVDRRLYPTDFTNYGPCTDISAPGKGIYSSYPVKDFRSFDGTSMAAPIVSGTIALMKSLKKDLTVKQAYNVLYKTGKDVYGNMPPMVQVDLALDAVRKGDFSDPPVRTMKPVPDAATVGDDGELPPASWIDPSGRDIVIVDGDVVDGRAPGVVPGDPANRNPGVSGDGRTAPGSGGKTPGVSGPAPGSETDPTPAAGSETDYDAIRRLIAKYKKKITELEKQLPENKR